MSLAILECPRELEQILGTAVTFRVASETSPGEPFAVRLSDHLNADAVAVLVCKTFNVGSSRDS